MEELHFNIQHTIDGKLKEALKKIYNVICHVRLRGKHNGHHIEQFL